MYRTLMKWACVTALTLFVLHLLATEFYWYTSIFGFDKVMHTLGGVVISLLAGALFMAPIKDISARNTFVTIVLCVFVVGLFWEFYEYAVQYFIKGVHLADIPDSIGDLIFDGVGGSIGAYFVILIKKRYNSSNERSATSNSR